MAEYPVHIGKWTDWSKGEIFGSQLTVTANTSNTLIALIAIFIAFAGGVAWTTLAYTIHQIRASRQETDGFHHLLQVLLRNVTSPLIFAFRVGQTTFTWRNLTKSNAFARTWYLIVLALSTYGLFVIAGILLAKLANTGDVLLRSPYCTTRSVNLTESMNSTEFLGVLAAVGTWLQQESQLVLGYAQQCYPTAWQLASYTSSGIIPSRAALANCNFYTKPTLNWTTSYPDLCPFKKGVCAGPGNNIIKFDTGYLDTNYDLGINDKKEDRLQFRKITTCSVIDTKRFSSSGFVESSIGSVATYSFGSNLMLPGNFPLVAADIGPNITFLYPFSSYLSMSEAYYMQTASTINLRNTPDGSSIPTFEPSPDMVDDVNRPISLFFLANRGIFLQPVDDPWFNATASIVVNNVTYYYSSQPGAVVGCVDEVELCNPAITPNRCMNVNQIVYNINLKYYNISATNISEVLGLNDHQETLAMVLAADISSSIMVQLIKYLGPYALSAKDYLLNGETDVISSVLPPGQWQVELQRFQAISMSGLQRSRFAFSAGPSNPILQRLFKPLEDEEGWKCASQKFRNSNYFSYSVLGIGLIFGLGGAVILASFVMTIVVPMVQLRTGKGIHRRDQWFTNDAAFLLASLYDAKGYGVWTTKPINHAPTTLFGDRFAAYTDTVVHSGDMGDVESQANTKSEGGDSDDVEILVEPKAHEGAGVV